MSTKTVNAMKQQDVKQLPMSTQKNNSKNDQNAGEKEIKALQNSQPQKAEEQKPVIAVLTAEQRLRSLENLQLLGARFKFLQDKEDSLNKFILSNDGSKEKITLSNASGFTFEVTNTQAIEKVIDVLTEHLTVAKEKCSNEILSFQI